MPKPTFFQAVLRKPTRSYANPQAASPWADYPDEQQYDGETQPYSRYDDGEDQRVARDEAEDAGPSQPRRRRAKSTASTMSESQSTIGPRSTKKKTQNVAERDETDELDPPVPTQPRRKKRVATAQSEAVSPDPSSRPTSPDPTASTRLVVRQKSKQHPIGVDISSSETSPSFSSFIADQTPASKDIHPRLIVNESSASARMFPQPNPSIPSDAGPAAAPSRAEFLPPMAINQTEFPARPVPPLTPPSSDMSSADSSATSGERIVKPLTVSYPTAPVSAKVDDPIRPHQVISLTGEATDEEDDAFRTPRASLDFTQATYILGDANVGTSVTPRPSTFSISPPILSANRPAPASLPQPTFAMVQERPVAPSQPSYVSLQHSTPSQGSILTSTATSKNTKIGTESFITPTRPVQSSTTMLSTRLSPSLGAPISSSTAAKPEIKSLLTIRPSAASRSPPSFMFLPPTPAPLPDPDVSPFHSEPASSDSSSSLLPGGPVLSRPVLSMGVASFTTTSQQKHRSYDEGDLPNELDDVESASGEVGSDDDEESRRAGETIAETGRRSRQSDKSRHTSRSARSKDRSRPTSVARSHTSASIDSRRPPSRQSSARQPLGRPYDGFVVHRRDSIIASEASFGGRSNVEGSIRSSPSGYGKGGWAAAAAARSAVSSPVMMYMPTSGNDGWAEFQPPPRESRFTPLPAASQPVTFDKLINGTSQGGLLPSDNGYGAGRRGGSSPSEYSQSSDEMLPKPSRSYARKNFDSEASHSQSASRSHSPNSGRSDGLPESRDQDWPLSVNSDDEPQQSTTPIPADGQWGRSYASAQSVPRPSARPPSRPMSPALSQSYQTSPIMQDRMPSRPSSRMGFDSPSFLNPDTLTILPEMSLADSAKTYQPTPSDNGRSRYAGRPDTLPKRANSVFGKFPRSAKSEVGHDVSDDEPEAVPRRAKSALGHRNGGASAKWEGSSNGDGILMESHGRVPDNAGGYT